jgi:metallophosphoesterase (TIGR03767 family)
MTSREALQGGVPNAGGYRQLVPAPGEEHRWRTELVPNPAELADAEPLLTIAHLSDIHICDAQSPARAEPLDRWADPDSPILDQLEEVGTYRAQEMLTAQVAEAMVRAVNAVRAGPVAARPIDFALATGDNIDNAQANELGWYLALLDGGTVCADSGDSTRWEGVADDVEPDDRFWHPDGTVPDLPRERYGFPVAPGLLDAARRAFAATGLAVPWLGVHGNHDRLVQGTLVGDGVMARVAVGGVKPLALPDGLTPDEVVTLINALSECDPAALALLATSRMRQVTPDERRRIISRAEFVAAHDRPAARPPRHGFPADGRRYYRYDTGSDTGSVTLLVLDTVNANGGWQGSLDREQFDWLRAELTAADAEHRYAVLASHHPLDTMVNDTAPDGEAPRVLGAELLVELDSHPSLVLWLNGHTHQTAITARASWWEVTAPSLIDWPQQARMVELLRGGGRLTIATTMLDHAGEAPWQGGIADVLALAGLSRELAANDWQWRADPLETTPRAGTPADRNVLLALPDPWT